MLPSDAAIVLFAHGARDPAWAGPIERLRQTVLAREPSRQVLVAFLDFMLPSLSDSIEQAIAAGARVVVVVPVFLAQGGHVRRDVPHILDAVRERHPAVMIELREALGEMPVVIDAMADAVLSR